jgi:hypothetical protein
VNQNFSGDNNHMRADMNAFVLWAFNNEYLGNIRYHNGTAGRQFTEQILAYNAVTIDRARRYQPDLTATATSAMRAGQQQSGDDGN